MYVSSNESEIKICYYYREGFVGIILFVATKWENPSRVNRLQQTIEALDFL